MTVAPGALSWDEVCDYREALAVDVEFSREDRRATRLKRRCDCGCWIDGGEPYRYYVAKLRGALGLVQRLDCEFCARVDARF